MNQEPAMPTNSAPMMMRLRGRRVTPDAAAFMVGLMAILTLAIFLFGVAVVGLWRQR